MDLSLSWLQKLPIDNVKSITPVSGGDVNKAYQVSTEEGPLFLLVQLNTTNAFYQEEIAGLNELEDAGISSPKVIANGEIEGHAYLLLEFIESSHGNQADLGRLVAQMHQVESENGLVGFYEPYMSTDIKFTNEWTSSWNELFIDQRLDKLKDAIIAKKYWKPPTIKKYEEVRDIIYKSLTRYESSPSLLHGDLWSGNFMFRQDGSPVLFDPHALYGDREFDIGITTVFGGFDHSFYQAYQDAFPLDKGADARLEFYRLYFLMVHLNKFGRTYQKSVAESLEKIIKSI